MPFTSVRTTPAGEPSPAVALLEPVTVTPGPSDLTHDGWVFDGDGAAVAPGPLVAAELPLVELEPHPAATSATMTPHAASPILLLFTSFPSRLVGRGRGENCRYPPVSAASSNLGGRLAAGIAAMSRICDSGRGSGTDGAATRVLATAPGTSRPRIATCPP